MWTGVFIVVLFNAKYTNGQRGQQSGQSSRLLCELPPCPEHGIYEAENLVDGFSNTMTITCHAGYQASGRRRINCKQGKWVPEMPKCIPSGAEQPGSNAKCYLPSCNYHGRLSLVETGMSLGQDVYDWFILNITCDDNYAVDSNDIVRCNNGRWDGEVPRCSRISLQLKTPIESKSEPMSKECMLPKKMPGTNVDYKTIKNRLYIYLTCNYGYKLSNGMKTVAQSCKGNSWQPEAKCEEIPCGKIGVEKPSIAGGTAVPKPELVPWNALLYYKEEHICGGTFVSKKAVISAAHCFKYKDLHPYLVAGGKLHRSLNDTLDARTNQISKIIMVYIPKDYAPAEVRYYKDIAIIELETPIQITNYISTICLPFNREIVDRQLVNKNLGKVAGMGKKNEIGEKAKTLQITELPYKDHDSCQEYFNRIGLTYYALPCDKFCAGFINGDTSVCPGDSGAGLVFLDGGKHYLQGIVSSTQNEGYECSTNLYGTFTKVAQHEAFVREKLDIIHKNIK